MPTGSDACPPLSRPGRARLIHGLTGYAPNVATRGDRIFGVIAILLSIGIIVAVATGHVTTWATIGASVLIISWLIIWRRRPPEKKVYRTHL